MYSSSSLHRILFHTRSAALTPKRLLALALLSTLLLLSTFLVLGTASDLHLQWRTLPPVRSAVPASHLHPLPLDTPLSQRIAALRTAPGISWEPADFVKWNLQTCADAEPNHNKDLLAKSTLVWGALSARDILAVRERMAAFLESQQRAGAFDPVPRARGGRGLIGEGRGIVFTAGNADTLSRVVTTLRLLRTRFNCTLPAAVFHFPAEAPAPSSPLRPALAALNATLVSATDRARDPKLQKNYQLKAQAIVECPWAEVLYLDSDSLPAADPALLFAAPNYARLGAFFTPDYWKTAASNPIWQILGVQCRDEWEQEAGQLVVDKTRHLDALLLAAHMLDDWRFWFHFSDGDKDVFRFAMLALRKRWALPGRYVGGGGLPSGTPSGDFCAHTMMQYDYKGEPMFVHYNLLKQIPSGVFLGYTWGRTKQVSARPQALLALNASLPVSAYPDAVVRGADDVEADMLANADAQGRTIYTGTEAVRRRAVLERGIRPFFHGGGNSAFCIDMRWEGEGGEGALEVVQWRDERRLREFEGWVYGVGFQPSGRGF